MKLFQYWDTGEPPEDVARGIESVRRLNPDLEHRLFDRSSAARFIRKHLGPREQEAFLSLAVPAMQADYLRLGALWVKGGLWIDADCLCLKPLRTLIRGRQGYLSMADHLLQTDTLFVRESGNAFLRACLELATRHIEAREGGDAYNVTGPRVLNLMWAAVDPKGGHERPKMARAPAFETTPEARAVSALYPGAGAAFACFSRAHDNLTAQWVKWIIAGYKATPADWRRWAGPMYLDG